MERCCHSAKSPTGFSFFFSFSFPFPLLFLFFFSICHALSYSPVYIYALAALFLFIPILYRYLFLFCFNITFPPFLYNPGVFTPVGVPFSTLFYFFPVDPFDFAGEGVGLKEHSLVNTPNKIRC